MADLHVAVIGAGIVGLNTALNLQERFPRCRIDLIADQFLEDVTSYGPPGLFRAGTTFHGPNPEITRKWISDSYNFYKSLSSPETGIFEVSGYIFSNNCAELTKNHYMEEILPIYRTATEEEKLCENISWKCGSYFATLITRCVSFLPWAQNKFQTQGGNIKRNKIKCLKELAPNYNVVINCSGLGAKYLCSDNNMIPIRGQLITVEAPWIRNFYFNDYDTYIFPIGSGKVILGGCRNFESYDTTVNKYDRASILNRCEAVLPSLRNAKFLSEWVGLRPYRPELRVELEHLENIKVVHNYGHGAFGISMAPGTAKYAIDLLYNSHISTCKEKCRL